MKALTTGQVILLVAQAAAALGLPEMIHSRDSLGINIVGGDEAPLGEFPCMISLSMSDGHHCGGVLLNAYTVITAAHCVLNTLTSAIKIRAGSLNWASGGIQVNISSYAVRPSFNLETADNDLAMVHLADPILEAESIGYATLPSQGSDPVDGSLTTVIGWGYVEENGSGRSDVLRKVSIPVVSRDKCQVAYLNSNITENMFCAGTGGKGSCDYDSGGPVIDQATGEVVGLVSWGNGCARSDYPGVYVRVGNYVDYITSSWRNP
ncbi:unnamed protein product [Clonostachys rhizophaga]|uniref:Peptidase S1 domain-containing protein n=1 Tax=Clonostachys rhizophaga TaxID=160324 RepID=A0A9N9VV82_9HYPO|nr:unnamed protein product [Clonostachys rhizophaga]